MRVGHCDERDRPTDGMVKGGRKDVGAKVEGVPGKNKKRPVRLRSGHFCVVVWVAFESYPFVDWNWNSKSVTTRRKYVLLKC